MFGNNQIINKKENEIKEKVQNAFQQFTNIAHLKEFTSYKKTQSPTTISKNAYVQRKHKDAIQVTF